MSRKKLNENELKTKLSIRINPKIYKAIEESYPNKSKYFEWLAYQDLLINNKIDKNILL
jgi:flagellar biosynthesis/type III secretory pathway protein FliH